MTTMALLAAAYCVFVVLVVLLFRAAAIADAMSEDSEGGQPVVDPQSETRSRRFRRSRSDDLSRTH